MMKQIQICETLFRFAKKIFTNFFKLVIFLNFYDFFEILELFQVYELISNFANFFKFTKNIIVDFFFPNL